MTSKGDGRIPRPLGERQQERGDTKRDHQGGEGQRLRQRIADAPDQLCAIWPGFERLGVQCEVVGTSEMYATKSNASRGATTVRGLAKIAGPAPIVEPAPRRERFETFVGEDKQTYFRLRAGNGEIVLGSEGYTSKAGALGGIESVRANGASAASYQIIETADGEFAIRLVAKNGEIVARGESYATKSNATRAIGRLVEILGHAPAAE